MKLLFCFWDEASSFISFSTFSDPSTCWEWMQAYLRFKNFQDQSFAFYFFTLIGRYIYIYIYITDLISPIYATIMPFSIMVSPTFITRPVPSLVPTWPWIVRAKPSSFVCIFLLIFDFFLPCLFSRKSVQKLNTHYLFHYLSLRISFISLGKMDKYNFELS